ncbi:hypothetical protein EDF81_3017 [Enterobacter sp. BIGb0383]|nr:hypothetical protein EDF81_3017 [Enterobacter sp. BIGb0383]ROS08358.1 hypothetical protein EC848_1819 [Enterobacter sp. BIGb0359]
MNLNVIAGMLAFFSGTLMANSHTCPERHQTAKQYTVNGQSDIPQTAFAVANQKRVPFYSAPDADCKTEGRYVVAGDFLRAYKHYGEYTYVSYTSVKGENIPGWVSTSALNDYSPKKAKPRQHTLGDTDFIVVGQARWFGLGSSWSRTFAALSDQEIASGYIGDFPNELGGLNKFSSHEYAGLSVVSSNQDYDKRLWGMDDDYIIQAITVTSAEYKTTRGIGVGDTLEEVYHAYNGIAAVETPDTLRYFVNDQSLSFTIANGKVASVDLVWRNQE